MADMYIDLMQTSCPTEIVTQVQQTHIESTEFFKILRQIIQNYVLEQNGRKITPECLAGFIGYSASKLRRNSSEDAFKTILSASLSVTPSQRQMIRVEIVSLYDKMPYPTVDARTYFKPLSMYKIDMRLKLEPKLGHVRIEEPDSFEFYYAQYLVTLGDERGIKRLDDAAKNSAGDAHHLNGMLLGIAEVEMKSVRYILERYQGDHRRGIGVNGPDTGPSVDEIVQNALNYRVWK